MVDEDDAPPFGVHGDYLVAEHRAGRRPAELLDVGPAQPAGLDGDELPGAARLGNLGERRLPGPVEGDGSDRVIVEVGRR
jgi:hypothetical protein